MTKINFTLVLMAFFIQSIKSQEIDDFSDNIVPYFNSAYLISRKVTFEQDSLTKQNYIILGEKVNSQLEKLIFESKFVLNKLFENSPLKGKLESLTRSFSEAYFIKKVITEKQEMSAKLWYEIAKKDVLKITTVLINFQNLSQEEKNKIIGLMPYENTK